MSPARSDRVRVAEIDWEQPSETEGLLTVLDAYAREEVGGGRSLSGDVRARLIPALRQQAHAVVFLAFVEGEVAGALTAFFGFSTFAARPLLNVHDLAVLPAFRRTGVGRALMLAAEERALGAGCVKLTLEVLESNAPARRLYRALGYGDFQLASTAMRTLFLSKVLGQKEPPLPEVRIREATNDDAPRVLAVVRASISELCAADHGHEPAVLDAWLANKTPESFARWLADPSSRLLVAEMDGVVRGVGSVGRQDPLAMLHLCYVEPGFVGRGLGRALLVALEEVARGWALEEVHLESTTNAQPFYLAHGYEPVAGCSAAPRFGRVQCRPFRKRLAREG